MRGRQSKLLTLVVFCMQLIMPLSLSAKTLKLIDETGLPIPNAVVGVPYLESNPPQIAHNIAVMDQINKQFKPRVLTIQQGQQVAFPNSDDIRHHVYSFSSTKAFEIKLFKGKLSSPITFDKPGIVVLGCNIHDQMIGYIYVTKDEQTYISNLAGEVTIADEASLVTIWHANLSAQNTKRETVDISQLQPFDEDGVLSLVLPLIIPQQDPEEPVKSTSKFKKKFN